MTIKELKDKSSVIVLENEPKDPDGKRKYKAILKRYQHEYNTRSTDFDGAWVLQIIRDFHEDNDWSGTPGSWFLDTLLGYDNITSNKERPSDTIYIDYGTKWYVTGMTKVLKEAEEMVYGKLDEAFNYAGDMRNWYQKPENRFGYEEPKLKKKKKITQKQKERLEELKDQLHELNQNYKDIQIQKKNLDMEKEEFMVDIQNRFSWDVLDLLNSGLSTEEKIQEIEKKNLLQDEKDKIIPSSIVDDWKYYFEQKSDEKFEEEEEELDRKVEKIQKEIDKLEELNEALDFERRRDPKETLGIGKERWILDFQDNYFRIHSWDDENPRKSYREHLENIIENLEVKKWIHPWGIKDSYKFYFDYNLILDVDSYTSGNQISFTKGELTHQTNEDNIHKRTYKPITSWPGSSPGREGLKRLMDRLEKTKKEWKNKQIKKS